MGFLSALLEGLFMRDKTFGERVQDGLKGDFSSKKVDGRKVAGIGVATAAGGARVAAHIDHAQSHVQDHAARNKNP